MNWIVTAASIVCVATYVEAQEGAWTSELGPITPVTPASAPGSSDWSELGSVSRVVKPPSSDSAVPTVKVDTRSDTDGADAPRSFEAHYWYFQGGIGPSFLTNTQVSMNSSLPDNQIEFYPGVRADAAIGYQFASWFGLEAELGLMGNSIRRIEGSPDTSGEFVQIANLVNAVFKLPTKSGFEPFVGVGAGFTVDGLHIDSGTVQGSSLHGSDGAVALAGQLAAGFKWRISERWGMAVEYEFLATTRPEFDLEEFTGASGTLTVRNPRSHSLNVRFEFKF